MKTLKEVSWNVTEEEYRKSSALSYSTLARFNREGFSKINELFEKISSSSLSFGSMVDTLLTDGIDAYNELYAVADFTGVGSKIATIIDSLVEEFSSTYDSLNKIPYQTLVKRLDAAMYQTNWAEETRISKFISLGEDYYKAKILAETKTIVSKYDHYDAIECYNAVINNDFTGNFFRGSPMEKKGIDREFQLKFIDKYEGDFIRCMVDLMVVDHNNKVIIPCDLKTSFAPEHEFFNSFVKWGYWIQAQLYWHIINENLKRDSYFKDFKLLDFRFIVISRNTKTPIVWTYRDTQSSEDCYYGKEKNIKCRHWTGLVKELRYYLKNKPPVPLGINLKSDNDIDKFLLDL